MPLRRWARSRATRVSAAITPMELLPLPGAPPLEGVSAASADRRCLWPRIRQSPDAQKLPPSQACLERAADCPQLGPYQAVRTPGPQHSSGARGLSPSSLRGDVPDDAGRNGWVPSLPPSFTPSSCLLPSKPGSHKWMVQGWLLGRPRGNQGLPERSPPAFWYWALGCAGVCGDGDRSPSQESAQITALRPPEAPC